MIGDDRFKSEAFAVAFMKATGFSFSVRCKDGVWVLTASRPPSGEIIGEGRSEDSLGGALYDLIMNCPRDWLELGQAAAVAEKECAA